MSQNTENNNEKTNKNNIQGDQSIPPELRNIKFKKLENPIGIEINGWQIRSDSKPLLNSNDLEKWEKELDLPCLPEMVFGYNSVTMKHIESEFEMTLNARDSLELVDKQKSSIQVGYADHWLKSKIAAGEQDKLVQGRQFDWTFSSWYAGSTKNNAKTDQHGNAIHVPIDYEQLKKREPIIFYDDLILFEDELADNGASLLTVKFRVMPTCFFVLQRHFVRVDDVMFRVIDTRFYHRFGDDVFVREQQYREATYDELRDVLPKDLSKLNDVNVMTPLVTLKSTTTHVFDVSSTPAAASSSTD